MTPTLVNPLDGHSTPFGLSPAGLQAQMQVNIEVIALLILANMVGMNGAAATGAVTQGARTLTSTTVSASGTVAAGALFAEFIFSSDFAGTVNGNTFSGATDSMWQTPPLSRPGDTLPAIAYTRSAGSIRLTVLT